MKPLPPDDEAALRVIVRLERIILAIDTGLVLGGLGVVYVIWRWLS